jgi:formylglycine-generating enzyme required for sulfatase activity
MLPDWLWLRTGLGLGALVKFASLNPPHTSQDLSIKQVLIWTGIDLDKGVKIPVIALEAKIMRSWSSLVMGKGAARSIGFVFDPNSLASDSGDSQTLLEPLNPEERVQRFWVSASASARKLARLLVAAPIITLPIVRIIQDTLLPRSHTYQIAEVFLGGLLKPLTTITPEVHPDEVLFVFVDEGIRDIILDGAPMTDSITVLDAVSRHVARRLNKSLREFSALLRKPNPDQEQTQDGIDLKAFALVQAKVLKRLGGDYTRFAEEIEREWQPSSTEKDPEPTPLPIFTAETVYVDRQGEIVNRETINIPYYDETLTREIEPIRMMAIPQGEFLMGSPESEEGRYNDESPQHLVKVPAFFMSQTPITQAQWRAIASLPEEGKRLDPDPSGFKGDNLPVEKVRWQDALEFCARLSRATGRNYRLPSEAEWEYACRGIANPVVKESKPFHFGETLTSNLANYYGTEIYQQEAKGEYRQKTTPIKSFPPNAFGLYDMHGNVWEWCLDPWHENYEGAPKDGKVWDEKDNDNRYHNILDNINVLIKDDRTHVLRGGAWHDPPRNCRSACRDFNDDDYYNVGFRPVFSFQDSSPLHS